MKSKLLLISILLLCVMGQVSGEVVNEDKARIAAQNWYRHFAPENKKSALVSRFSEYKHNERTAFYIYNFDLGGFVLVSANDAVTPVLGYGFDHAAPVEIASESVKGWLDSYARQIDTAFVLNLKNNEMAVKWQEVLDDRIPVKSGKGVGPLLTTTWDQGWPYNAMCPEDPNGPGGHTWAGCVAVAMAQIMNYHGWPKKSAGKLDYLSIKDSINNTISVNFSEQNYHWDSMPNVINNENMEVAKLLFNVGVGVGSQYGINSTSVSYFSVNTNEGAFGTSLPMDIAFSTFFRYNYDSIKPLLKTDAVYDADFILLLKKEINSARPIYYQGGNYLTNHAWVCDGYDENDFFNFNFGWSGSYNGYYSVNPKLCN